MSAPENGHSILRNAVKRFRQTLSDPKLVTVAGNPAMSRILLKLAERSLPSMLLRDFQLLVKSPVMQLV